MSSSKVNSVFSKGFITVSGFALTAKSSLGFSDSAVLRLNILKEPPVKVDDEKKFFKVVKAAFSQRRKTLSNSLASGLSLPKAEVNAILENSSVPLNARAEQLKLEDFANIANNLGD